jgi:hypothetical protein
MKNKTTHTYTEADRIAEGRADSKAAAGKWSNYMNPIIPPREQEARAEAIVQEAHEGLHNDQESLEKRVAHVAIQHTVEPPQQIQVNVE